MGIALRKASNRSREMVNDISDGVEFIVRVVIRFAPVGIYGLVSNTFATAGFAALVGYVQLLLVLIGCMLFVALVLNPPHRLVLYAPQSLSPHLDDPA